jgi:CYTH domain-containing protein
VLDPKSSQDSRVKISIDSRYKISVCKTRESRYEIRLRDLREVSLTTKFLSARLLRSEFRYEISVCETREKGVLLLILTR